MLQNSGCIMSVKRKKRLIAGNHLIIRKKKQVGQYVNFYVWITLAVLLILIPLYIMIVCSVMTPAETNDSTFHWWPEQGFSIEGYQLVIETDFGGVTLLKGFFNTLLLYVPSIVIGCFVSSIAAYAFAKIEFKTKAIAFAILMFGMTLPNSMGIAASVILYDMMGWMDTLLPIMVPRMMGSIGIVFFLRQFYMGVPDDLIEAGYIDGFNHTQIFFYIMLPLSIPSMLSQFILTFISSYNDYLSPLLYLPNNMQFAPVALVIQNFSGAYSQIWCQKMAACAISMFPLLILYLISQKIILKGVAITSGLKG